VTRCDAVTPCEAGESRSVVTVWLPGCRAAAKRSLTGTRSRSLTVRCIRRRWWSPGTGPRTTRVRERGTCVGSPTRGPGPTAPSVSNQDRNVMSRCPAMKARVAGSVGTRSHAPSSKPTARMNQDVAQQAADLRIGRPPRDGLQVGREGADEPVVLRGVAPDLPACQPALGKPAEEGVRHRRMPLDLGPQRLHEASGATRAEILSLTDRGDTASNRSGPR
jgi:hypothetical protein